MMLHLNSLSTWSLSVISWLALVTLVDGIDCHEWQSCASSDISETGSTTLECYGYQSCMNSSISVTGSADVHCYAAYSCAGGSVDKSAGTWMDCYGFHSCSNVNPLYVTSGHIVGFGASAVVNSNVTASGTMYCYGDRTCADSFIVAGGTHGMYGHLSGQNSIFKSYDSSVPFYFYATMSGKDATILCGNGHTCTVNCWGNACIGLNLTCIDGTGTCTFSITCTYADYDENVCPDGEKLSSFMNGNYLPDLSNVSSSYSDYQTGLNDCKKTGIVDTDFCGGYQSCNGRQLKNNSVCCSGGEGCASAKSIKTEGSSSSSFVRCDGHRACNGITNGINITKASSGSNFGIIYISASYYSSSTGMTVDAGGDGDIVCTGWTSCGSDTIINGNNLYCNGYYSCRSVTVSDITNVYAYAYYGARYMTVVDNVKNVYCGSYGCYDADISNVDNDVYCYGYKSLYSGTITNVKNVFVFGYEAVSSTTITNVTQLYCDGTSSCKSSTISNVSNIEANGTNVLDGATISSGGDGGTMTVTLYSGVTGSVSITCETADTCVFYCNHTNMCNTISLTCNGICVFAISTSNTTHSPTTLPSSAPTTAPSTIPTKVPSTVPTKVPTQVPTAIPSTIPTTMPSTLPTSLVSNLLHQFVFVCCFAKLKSID